MINEQNCLPTNKAEAVLFVFLFSLVISFIMEWYKYLLLCECTVPAFLSRGPKASAGIASCQHVGHPQLSALQHQKLLVHLLQRSL